MKKPDLDSSKKELKVRLEANQDDLLEKTIKVNKEKSWSRPTYEDLIDEEETLDTYSEVLDSYRRKKKTTLNPTA